MAGVTDTQSLRFGQVSDVITHTMVANLADDIATQLDAADTARTKALKRPQAALSRNTVTGVPVSTVNIVTFDQLVWDTHGMINIGTQPTRVTVSASAGAGLYQVVLQDTVDTTGWTRGDVVLLKNGTMIMQKSNYSPASNVGFNASFELLLAVNDFLTFGLFHEGGGTTNSFGTDVYVQKISD